MFIFLTNTPREYAWGSTNGLPDLLGVPVTGKPQAELWLGAHPGAPASVAKATPNAQTLIDLISADPHNYGVGGGGLPFLVKVLAIARPLSLQVHPNRTQAELGFASEELAGVKLDHPSRNYGDANHKPELLVAVSEVLALCGFRGVAEVRFDLRELERAAAADGDERGESTFRELRDLLVGDEEEARRRVVSWALGGTPAAAAAAEAIARRVAAGLDSVALSAPERGESLRRLASEYPNDAGCVVSLLLHVVLLQPGEAIYLAPQQLHAYLSGVGVEIMAASDNVLRAGFTQKHIDVAELERVVDYSGLSDPKFSHRVCEPGVVAWEPPVQDFRLLRITLVDESVTTGEYGDPPRDEYLRRGVSVSATASFVCAAEAPLLVLVTSGKVRVARQTPDLDEVAMVRRGQCVYVSAGDAIELSGTGEAFVGTVGALY